MHTPTHSAGLARIHQEDADTFAAMARSLVEQGRDAEAVEVQDAAERAGRLARHYAGA